MTQSKTVTLIDVKIHPNPFYHFKFLTIFCFKIQKELRNDLKMETTLIDKYLSVIQLDSVLSKILNVFI